MTGEREATAGPPARPLVVNGSRGEGTLSGGATNTEQRTADLEPGELRFTEYDGPLDLLLQLIERHQLDITTVSLARVTDQYLDQIRATNRGGAAQQAGSDQLSEFVVVAAKLLLIKSVALLPRPERFRPEQPPEDPTDLTERLRQYEVYKQAAVSLRCREEAGLRSFPHVPPSSLVGQGSHGAVAALAGVRGGQADGARSTAAPAGLLVAFRRAASRRPAPSRRVARESWSIAQAIAWLGAAAVTAGRSSFRMLTAGFGRVRLVAAFLAMLELHRVSHLRVTQARSFGEIELTGIERQADEQSAGG